MNEWERIFVQGIWKSENEYSFKVFERITMNICSGIYERVRIEICSGIYEQMIVYSSSAYMNEWEWKFVRDVWTNVNEYFFRVYEWMKMNTFSRYVNEYEQKLLGIYEIIEWMNIC